MAATRCRRCAGRRTRCRRMRQVGGAAGDRSGPADV